MIDNEITGIDKYIPKNLKINKNIKYENIKNTDVISSLTIYKYYIIYCSYTSLYILNLKHNIKNEIKPTKRSQNMVPDRC